MSNNSSATAQWHAALIDQGAELNKEQEITFKYQTTENQTAPNECFYLQHLSCIEVRGADAFSFLQGQLSCDMNAIHIEHSGIGTHNNLKGRMLSSFRVLQTAEQSYSLIIDRSIAEDCVAQLKKYAVFSKVTIEQNPQKVCLALRHVNIQASWGGLSSQSINASTQLNNAYAIQIDSLATRFLLLANAEDCISLWADLRASYTPQNISLWKQYDIEQGLAWVIATTQDRFLPQSFNYHSLGGIGFKKGCYIGQEIIVRAQHRGKLKRQLYLLQINTDRDKQEALSIGLDLMSGGKSIGSIVASELTADNSTLLLAVLHEDYANPSIMLQDQDLNKLQLLALKHMHPDSTD